jgi:hypothetical protein
MKTRAMHDNPLEVAGQCTCFCLSEFSWRHIRARRGSNRVALLEDVECKAHSVLSSGEELDVGRNDKVKSLMSMCRFRRFCEKDASLTTCIFRFLARKQPFSSESCLIPVERVDRWMESGTVRCYVVLWLSSCGCLLQ